MSSPHDNLYKQIIMYILHRSKSALSQNVIIDTMVNLGYTDYINAQSALGNLIRTGMCKELETYHRSYISLMDTGEKSITTFIDHLSPDIRREIDEYLRENHIETLDETVLISDYRLASNGYYLATCSVKERGDTVFSISILVASEEDAVRVCDSWKEQSEALYSEALQKLLSNPQ